MATLTVQSVSKTGATPAYVAATGGGDAMATGPRNYLHVKNGGSTMTVTVASAQNCNQGFAHDIVVSVTGGQERMIGPITSVFANASTGLAVITYSAVTTVTVGAFSVAAA